MVMKKLLRVLAIIIGLAVIGVFTVVITAVIYTLVSESTPAQQVYTKPITADGLFLSVNEARNTNGIPPLARNAKLDESARLKCEDMATSNYYAHDNPATGFHGYDYIDKVGVEHNYASENLNSGVFVDSKAAVTNWMASEAHRAAILDPKYTQTGFATCSVPNMGAGTVMVEHFVEPAT